MKSKLQQFAGWLIQSLVLLYFRFDAETAPARRKIYLFLYKIWGKYPALKQDILHSSLTMITFTVLLVGSANDVRWLTAIGLFALAFSLVLGTLNIFYDFSKA